MKTNTIKTGLTRGFTLIELLVVIAIIGILASVVLASLNSARDKGADAAAKSSLNNMRAQMELYYDNTSNTYDAGCGDPTVAAAMAGAASAQGGGTVYTSGDAAVSSATVVTCHDTATGWAAQTPLKTGTSFCVDSTGKAMQTANFLGNADITCS